MPIDTMVKHELIAWVKDGLSKGHELEKLLSHLKTQGYPDVEIVQIRHHVSGKKPVGKTNQKLLQGQTFMHVLSWIPGVFFEPEKTMKETAEHSKLTHVGLMGAISVTILFLSFILQRVLLEGTMTLPSQIMNKFTLIIAPQGSFSAVIGFGGLTLTGVLGNLIVAILHYFLPLLGIAFVAHLILHGLYHKSTMWKAYKIIGIPFGACSIAIGLINLMIIPILFISELIGSASFIAKTINAGMLGAIVLLIFFIIVISMYSYLAYAMAMKEKYEATMTSAIFISLVSTAAVVLALMPLMTMFVASVF